MLAAASSTMRATSRALLARSRVHANSNAAAAAASAATAARVFFSSAAAESAPVSSKSILVYGGNGGLGQGIIAHFNENADWTTCSVDFAANADANANVIVDGATAGSLAGAQSLRSQLQLDHPDGFDMVVCAAGGWGGGDVSEDEIFATLDTMLDVNMRSAVTASWLACHTLKRGGIFTLTGSAAVLEKGGTPFMAAYGAVKAATHHLVASVATSTGLPQDARVAGLLPVTIDTPGNRAAMPDADTSEWTPPSVFADILMHWSGGANNFMSVYPSLDNGALYTLTTATSKLGVSDTTVTQV